MIHNANSRVQLADVLSLKRPDVRVVEGERYDFAGVKSFGGGVFRSASKLGSEFAYKTLIRVQAGQFVYPKLMAWEGALGVVPLSCTGLVVSPEFCVFDVNGEKVLPGWLDLYFRQPSVWPTLAGGSVGTNVRRRRIYPQDFLKLCVPIPSIAVQSHVVQLAGDIGSRIADLKARRDASRTALDCAVRELEMRIWPDSDLHSAPALVDVTNFLSRGRQSAQGKSEHFLIKSQHVQMGRYVPSQLTLAPEVAAKVIPDALARPGDTLIACSAAGCLGRVAYFDTPGVDASTDTHVAIARARPDIVLPEYLYAYLSGAQGQIQLRSRERGDWTKEKVSFRLAELNLADLRKVPIPVPSIQKQRLIVERVELVREKVAAVRARQREQESCIKAVSPALLSRAFKALGATLAS